MKIKNLFLISSTIIICLLAIIYISYPEIVKNDSQKKTNGYWNNLSPKKDEKADSLNPGVDRQKEKATAYVNHQLDDGFKNEQLKFPRVREAFDEKGGIVKKMLEKLNIDVSALNIYMRAFKQERILEVWAKAGNSKKYRLLVRYDFCEISGDIGPKQKRGDNQTPEGFYHIDRFNPKSRFHLSLGLNYPNKADKLLNPDADLGSDIFIHGNCVTVGCIPITDEKIKELYILAVEAVNSGQKTIPISIFPCRLTDEKMEELEKEYGDRKEFIDFWLNIKQGFDCFERCKELPDIAFSESGKYKVSSNCD